MYISILFAGTIFHLYAGIFTKIYFFDFFFYIVHKRIVIDLFRRIWAALFIWTLHTSYGVACFFRLVFLLEMLQWPEWTDTHTAVGSLPGAYQIDIVTTFGQKRKAGFLIFFSFSSKKKYSLLCATLHFNPCPAPDCCDPCCFKNKKKNLFFSPAASHITVSKMFVPNQFSFFFLITSTISHTTKK